MKDAPPKLTRDQVVDALNFLGVVEWGQAATHVNSVSDADAIKALARYLPVYWENLDALPQIMKVVQDIVREQAAPSIVAGHTLYEDGKFRSNVKAMQTIPDVEA